MTTTQKTTTTRKLHGGTLRRTRTGYRWTRRPRPCGCGCGTPHRMTRTVVTGVLGTACDRCGRRPWTGVNVLPDRGLLPEGNAFCDSCATGLDLITAAAAVSS